MRRSELRSHFTMVLQDTWLFRGTVAENIAYGVGIENVSRAKIEEAAKHAYIHNFINLLPNGYDTVISGTDGHISQGQKQLLCIARAMLVSAPILILDEATSNIDTLTEIDIQRAFAVMMKDKTSVIIAHRLSTIKEADSIAVMENGAIAEYGTHSELLALGGKYREFIKAMEYENI
jgi:ABC-type multidrug transport system fused ATPase/permease subunit